MFLAVIGDILSNACSLQTVLDHLEEEGIREVVHTGNICLAPEGASACVQLLRKRAVMAVQGRLDRALVSRKAKAKRLPEAAELEKSYALLDSSAIEFLNGLPRKRSFTREGVEWLLCHGAVNSPSEILTEDTSFLKFQRQREECTARIVISGGSTEPFSVDADGTLFASAGTLLTREGKIRYTLIDTEVYPFEARVIML